MAKKKKKYEVDHNAVIKGGENQWGSIYLNMFTHKAFIELPNAAKNLYSCCRIQSQSQDMRQNLYNYKKELMRLYGFENEGELYKLGIPANVFVFPSKHAKKFGYDKGNFSRYMGILEQAGFIKKIIAGKKQKKQNLYAFSSAWKGEEK